MTRLRIEHLDTPWQVASVHEAANGGWPSVQALQAYNEARGWHPPMTLRRRLNTERAERIERGVVLQRLVEPAGWVPFCRLEITP